MSPKCLWRPPFVQLPHAAEDLAMYPVSLFHGITTTCHTHLVRCQTPVGFTLDWAVLGLLVFLLACVVIVPLMKEGQT